MQKNDTRSLNMLIFSMLIFGSVGIFRRYIPLSSAAIACFRGACGAFVLLLAALVRKRKLVHHIGPKRILLLVLSGVAMGFNWILLFEAYRCTTVATATLCYYMQPTIVMLLSPLLFRERMTLRKGLCALAAIIGMVFVSGAADSGLPTAAEARGILCGLGAAVLYSTVVILNKKLPGIDVWEKTIVQLVSAAVALLPYVLVQGPGLSGPLTAFAIIMLLTVGLVHTGLTYALYFGSMDGLRAQTVALVSYLDPITALILSALILHEQLTVFGLLGAFLIIGAALFSELTD